LFQCVGVGVGVGVDGFDVGGVFLLVFVVVCFTT
jgi:hypothetical protein